MVVVHLVIWAERLMIHSVKNYYGTCYNFLYLLPDDLIFYRTKGIPTLKESNFHALLNGNMNIKLFPWNITGNLKASNVYIPDYPKPFIQNDVNAFFMKDKVRVYPKVYTPENEYVVVDGVSNLDNSLYGKYSVKSTKKIDLKFAKLYLVPIQQIIGFNIGPVPIMEMSGYGNIDIKTQGTIYDAQIFGEFNAFNATAQIDGLNAKIQNGVCKLIFNDRNLFFKEIKGKIANGDFLLTGKANTKGEVDLIAKINNLALSQALNIFNFSEITKSYKILSSEIDNAKGNIDTEINLKGLISDYEKKEFLNKLALSGNLSLKENSIVFKNGADIENVNGVLTFGDYQKGNFEFDINNSKFFLDFSSNDSLAKIQNGSNFHVNTTLSSPKFAFLDIFNELNKIVSLKIIDNISEIDFYSKLVLNSQGSLSLKNIDLSNFRHNGYIIGLNSSKNKNIKFNSGLIKFANDKMLFDNFNMSLFDGNIKANGFVRNFLSKNPSGDLSLAIKDIGLASLNDIFPQVKLEKGKLKNGQITLKNRDIKFNSINIDYQGTPMFINANLKDAFVTKALNAEFATILSESSADYIINPYLTYPIKIKGEVPLKGSFKGNSENYQFDFSASIPKESDISFSGANLGDSAHKREIAGKIEVNKNIAKINNLRLIRYIANQNNKINPMVALKANGQIIQSNNEIYYNNFKVATNSPINVRILNLIFKKSILKKGNFECNIDLNGNIKSPKVIGKVLLEDLEIPLYDTQVNTIKLNIVDKFIDGEILAKNKLSDVKLVVRALNKLKPPYVIEKLDISSNKLDIPEIISSLSSQSSKSDIIHKSEFTIKPSDVIIKNGVFDFKEVKYNQVNAQNLKGYFNYKDELFNLRDIDLDIAQGKISASGKYNLSTTKLLLNAQMFECDSNELALEFLNLPNQIYGKMNGNLDLKAKNINTFEGIQNAKLDVDFSINNGKMPKLGSLEYLLRAGNILKNGLLGLSLNNIIQVLTPYKTGQFEKINGNLTINNAEIEKLEIFSQGKNLSLYLNGTYSIFEKFADIKIYGKLSQNVQSALGAVGNASVHQFITSITRRNKSEIEPELMEKLNKIPPIETNETPVFFSAKVLGDINKDNYIKSFNWE